MPEQRGAGYPNGPVLSDVRWVREIADKYQLGELYIPVGSVVLEKTTATGGRTFMFIDHDQRGNEVRNWVIGISRPRLDALGREGMEGIVAHELLHAWLWCRFAYMDHGEPFMAHAAARGIPRWCSHYDDALDQSGQRQLALFG